MNRKIESKEDSDNKDDKRFEAEKAQLYQYMNMEENSDKAQWVRKYMLKRLLEKGEKRDFGWREEVVQDTEHIKKMYEWEVKEDVYRAYQKEVLSEIKNDLFQSLSAAEKRAIATSFDDMDADVEINGEKYKREFSEDSWDTYFKKNNIKEGGLTHGMDREMKVMDQIAEILYGKKFNELVDLQINPESTKPLKTSTKPLKTGDQIKLDFS